MHKIKEFFRKLYFIAKLTFDNIHEKSTNVIIALESRRVSRSKSIPQRKCNHENCVHNA